MLKTEKVLTSKDGTQKYLFRLDDGNQIETVLMKHPYGNSVCVSSQAGCNMGCAFCASGLLKKVRDLTAEEMLLQVQCAQEICTQSLSDSSSDSSGRITHIVVMGTGEPFDNYEEVLRFCNRISTEVAPRHITVSTCGIVPKIRAFSETEKRYNLAISLHAPDNELRSRLMPVNKTYPVEEVIAAADEYCKKTRRRITFEYLLLEGVNDTEKDALKLASLLKDNESFYVNLIPYNAVSEFGFQGSSKDAALSFYDILMKNGVKATLRKERGTDISAACGQLRLRGKDSS